MGIGDSFEALKRIVGGFYNESPTPVSDGAPVSMRLGDTGQLYVIGDGCTIRFRPQAGTGQALTISGVSNRSTALTIGKRHWIWSTQDVWVVRGGSSVNATTSDFPLPARAVAEYTPSAASNQYVAVIQMDQVGTVYIAQSED